MRHVLRTFFIFCPVAAGLGLAGISTSSATRLFDISALPVGTVFRWQATDGTTTERFLGRDGERGYKFSFRRDGSNDQPLDITSWVTRDGQLTRFEGPDIADRYLPNDCSLTLGRCKYIVIHKDGSRDSMINIATERDGRWTYQLFRNRISEATQAEYGTFTVDRYGIVVDHSYVLADGQRGWLRRLDQR